MLSVNIMCRVVFTAIIGFVDGSSTTAARNGRKRSNYIKYIYYVMLLQVIFEQLSTCATLIYV
jgi:hypothetical protein